MSTISSEQLAKLQEAVVSSPIASSTRALRQSVNDYVDAHPELRQELVAIAANRDGYRRGYDQQRHMEQVIYQHDESNGHALANLEIKPSQLIEYARDRVNKHAAHAGFRITRGRIQELQLTDKSGSQHSE